jgi:hypothetical protein
MVEKLNLHEKKNKKAHSHSKKDGHGHSHGEKEKSTKGAGPAIGNMVLEDIVEEPKDVALANMNSLTSSKGARTPKNQTQNSEASKNKPPFATNGPSPHNIKLKNKTTLESTFNTRVDPFKAYTDQVNRNIVFVRSDESSQDKVDYSNNLDKLLLSNQSPMSQHDDLNNRAETNQNFETALGSTTNAATLKSPFMFGVGLSQRNLAT